MCFGSKETGSKTTQLPPWMDEAGQFLTGYGTDLANKPFEAYTGERVADFSGDQTNAFQRLRDLISGAPNIGPEVLEGFRTAANAGPQVIGTERVVDEGGRLGAISDYTNPYTDAVLEPVLRRIQEQSDAQRKRIGAGATTAGAFGDARHGVLEAGLGRDTSTAMTDASNKAYSDAFNAAMGLRSGDLGRFGATDVANAQFSETALNRLMTGSAGMMTQATADQNRLLTQIQALLGSGATQQGLEQSGLDKTFEEFQRAYGHPFNVMAALSGALKSTPTGNTVTESKPDNSGFGLLGSILAAAKI